jgi:hypothetical protein
MTGRSDITAGAAKIYASGLKLGKEISDMIVGTVTEYATDIENFVNRKHELLDVDAKFLFFFAIAVELNFVSAAWQEQKTTDIIDEIAHIASQHFEFTSSSMKTESELAIERKTFRESLYKMYENLQSSWIYGRKTEPLLRKRSSFSFSFYIIYDVSIRQLALF